MPEKRINLWTIHSDDFSISEGCVDHSKSIYYKKTKGVKDAYPELWKRLSKEVSNKEKSKAIEEGQIIWCFTSKDEICRTGIRKIKWDLFVPESEVTFMDSLVWNRILGIRCGVGSEMSNKWKDGGLEKYPYDIKKARYYEKKCCDKFWSQKPASGSWWDELFVDDKQENASCALISHPVPDSWILEKCEWMA